jgi:hypothetical protein
MSQPTSNSSAYKDCAALKLARRRALLVETLMIDAAGNKNIVFGGRFAEKGGSDKSRSSVVVTIDRPAD